MGKTKYIDEETIGQRQGNSAALRYAAGRRGGQTLGRFEPSANEPSLHLLYEQIRIRLRRTWVSLRFQFHRATFGLLKNNGAYKLGTLALTGYLLLWPDRDPAALLKNPLGVFAVSQTVEAIEPMESGGETTLEIGSGATLPAGGKSVKWPANDAAPVGVAGVKEDEARTYVARFAKIAQAEMSKFGIPASISLAQGLVESRAGGSTLARRNNNHFGMKCFSKKCAKGHCSNFTDDSHKDFFRIYGNAWESWRAHSEMLASGRYATLRKHGSDYRKWAYGLKSLGYATDRNYAEKLIGMIERYDLHKYDR